MTHNQDPKLDPLAVELDKLDRHIATLSGKLSTARTERADLRYRIKCKIIAMIAENPQLTNVQIAALFGIKSETTVRNLRNG